MVNWIPLHNHSQNSLLDGYSKPKDMVARCKELGYSACALTDHGNISGCVAFFKECKEAGIKAILGCEFYFVDNAKEKNTENKSMSHVVILSKNLTGWYELIQCVSESNKEENFYHKPRIDYSVMKKFLANGNHVCISGHPGTAISEALFTSNTVFDAENIDHAYSFLREDWKESAKSVIKKHLDIFGADFFLEIQLIDSERLHAAKIIANCLREISVEMNIPTVATGDSHYVRKSDATYQRILLCSALNKTLPEIEKAIANRDKVPLKCFFVSDNYHIPTPDEIEALHTQEEINNSHRIADLCEDYDILNKPSLPKFACPNNISEIEHLKELCRIGWRNKLNPDQRKDPVYIDRIKEELAVIEEADLSGYFLIVQDIVNWVRSQGWLPGPGRGSAAGCLISYLIGITRVDPIPYNLLFSRFYNSSRKGSLPDIDVDVPAEHRDEIIEYIKNKYGRANVSQMATFGRLQGRSALKEVMRVEDSVSFAEMNEITKALPNEAEIADELEEMDSDSIILWALINTPKKLEKWCKLNEDGSLSGDLSDIFQKAIAIEGTYKSKGKHAAGVIISAKPLAEVCPMARDRNGDPMADFEMGDLEATGQVKLDILGVDILSKIMKVAEDKALDINDFFDKDVWSMLSSGDTKGVFQLESQLGKSWAKRLKPRNIEELSALIALIRPGCISGDSKILIKKINHTDGNLRNKTITMRDLYKNKHIITNILSYNEETGVLIPNDIKDVFYTGIKECFKIKIKTHERKTNAIDYTWYDLECTNDHKLLTPSGWTELKDLQYGDRILVTKKKNKKIQKKQKVKSRYSQYLEIDNFDGLKSYKSRCYQTYQYKCIFCDWNKGSLDVNHIDGNRHTNNSPDNLCYMCPNHHREYTEGSINKEQVIQASIKHKLPDSIDCKWATFVGKESVGQKDVYDITMSNPHHNFIAGNIVVHNCLEAFFEGKSMTQHYIDRKHGLEEVKYFHPSLEPILKDTYGVLVYQEQSMILSRELAGFSLEEADTLRKAMGKKLPELMAKVKKDFLEGCKKVGKVSEEEAAQIFDWIEASQRYSFNKSHSVSYAINGFNSAYCKYHNLNKFYEVYLDHARRKQDTQLEIKELINDAKIHNIEILPPRLNHLYINFKNIEDRVYFGISNIKDVGETECKKIQSLICNINMDKFTWMEILCNFADVINKRAFVAMISTGCFNGSNNRNTRNQMLYDFDNWKNLTVREKEFIRDNLNIEKNLLYHIELLINNFKIASNRLIQVIGIKQSLEKPMYDLNDEPTWIAQIEEKYFGASLTCSKTDFVDSNMINSSCKDIFNNTVRGSANIAVQINTVREYKIKSGNSKGQTMAFLSVEDSSAALDSVIIFPDAYTEFKPVLYEGNTVIIMGRPSNKKDGSLIIDKVCQI